MTAFLIIGSVGVLLLLASLVVGDLIDGVLDFGGDLFSGSALAGFLGAFGFGGALALDATGSSGVGIGVGLLAGVVIGAGVGVASARLRRGGDQANVRTGDLVGRPAVVVNAIPEEGYGEVSLTVAGHPTKLNARSSAGVRPGTSVTITVVLSPTSVAVVPRS